MKTYNMVEIDLSMSNFDNKIDEGFEETLMKESGEIYGAHYAYNFYGKVFFFEGKFYEEVMVHGNLVDTIEADTLEDLMVNVSNKYGWD